MAKFPPLPEYLFLCPIEKLRARDLEIWRMAMEEAARACSGHLRHSRRPPGEYIDGQNKGVERCLDIIRALPEPVHE